MLSKKLIFSNEASLGIWITFNSRLHAQQLSIQNLLRGILKIFVSCCIVWAVFGFQSFPYILWFQMCFICFVFVCLWGYLGQGHVFPLFFFDFFYFFILFLNSDFFERERNKVFGLWWLQRWRGFGRTGGGGILFKKTHIHA